MARVPASEATRKRIQAMISGEGDGVDAHIGNVHEHGHSRRVLRVNERSDVGNAEWPEKFLALGRGKPVSLVTRFSSKLVDPMN